MTEEQIAEIAGRFPMPVTADLIAFAKCVAQQEIENVQFEVAAYKEQIPVGLVDERDTVDEVDAILMARWSAYSREWMESDEFKAMMTLGQKEIV